MFVRPGLGIWSELGPAAGGVAPAADGAVRPVSTTLAPSGRLLCNAGFDLLPQAEAFAAVANAAPGGEARARRAVETVAVTFLPLTLVRERPVERTVQFRGVCTVAGQGAGAQPGGAAVLANAVGEVAFALEGEPPPQPDEALTGAELTVSGMWQPAGAAAADLAATCKVAVRRPGRTEWQPLDVLTFAPVATLAPAALQDEWERWRADEQAGGLSVTRTWEVPPELCAGAGAPGVAVVSLMQAGAGPAFAVAEVTVKLKLRRHEHD